MVDRVVKRGKTRVGVEREVDVSGAGLLKKVREGPGSGEVRRVAG